MAGNVTRNSEHYYDPTCCDAISDDRNIIQDECNKLVKTILYICDVAGFRIQGQIMMRHKKSNKVYTYKKG
jgi:hypothetical protein